MEIRRPLESWILAHCLSRLAFARLPCGWQWGEHHGICWKRGSFYHSSKQRSHCLETSVLRVHFMKVTLPTFQFYSCVCLKIPFISCLKIHECQGARNIFISHVQICRLSKKEVYFFLSWFRKVPIVHSHSCFILFHCTTSHLLTDYVIYLFILFIVLYPFSWVWAQWGQGFCMFLINAIYSQHLK